MRRVSVARATPGMVLGRAVYDIHGQLLLEEDTVLTEREIRRLSAAGTAEVLVRDSRLADIPIVPLFPEYLEARATHGLHQILTDPEIAKQGLVAQDLLPILPAANQLVQCLYPAVMGDPDLTGCASLEGYDFVHPVKTAGLALLIGRLAGLDKADLQKLALASLLMNVGYLRLRRPLTKAGALDVDERKELQRHPILSRRLMENCNLSEDVLHAIEDHHERWDGRGYPNGRGGGEISPFAQIVAIADTYYALISKRPHRPAYRPHEAAEFIVAASGEMFDPELVQFFARKIPHYAVGVCVRLSTNEIGFVIDPNHGHVARPLIRVCYERNGVPVQPYDLDLSRRECMNKIIVEVTT